MNIVEAILAKAIVKGPSEWEKDETIYDEGEILGVRRYDNPMYSDPTFTYLDIVNDIKFKVSDGIHRFVDIPFEESQDETKGEIVELIRGTYEELAIKLPYIPLRGQIICELFPGEECKRKFKIGDGFRTYDQLPYVMDPSEFPFIFIANKKTEKVITFSCEGYGTSNEEIERAANDLKKKIAEFLVSNKEG